MKLYVFTASCVVIMYACRLPEYDCTCYGTREEDDWCSLGKYIPLLSGDNFRWTLSQLFTRWTQETGLRQKNGTIL